MKLSLWTISDYLKKAGFEVAENITGGLPCVNVVNLATTRTYSTEFAELLENGSDCVLYNDMDNIVIKNARLLDVANTVNAAIAYYTAWEKDLYDSMIHSASLQELLDIANTVFERPMFIKNDSTRTFAITRGYPNSVHPHWDRITASLDEGIPDYEVVRTVSSDPDYKSAFLERYPSVRWSPAYGNMVLHTNIFVNDRRVAEIVMLENGKTFNNGEIHVMSVFADLIEKYVSLNPSIFQSGSDVSVYLTSLIEGGKLEKDQLMTICKYIGLDPEDEFCVLIASNIGLLDSPMLSSLREKLEVQLKDAIVIPYKSKIVIVRGIKGRKYSDLIEDFKVHIPKEGFCWALSYEFFGIENVPIFYKQACKILENAVFHKENYMPMYEIAPHFISDMYMQIEDSKSYVHPDLLRLEKIDMTENTQYCETLFYFLLCGGNYTDASKIMMLHRNTMIYRLNKIREIVRSNIDDADNRKLLLYSYLLLGKDY